MNYNGQALREKMLGTFGTMLRPARMIMNLSREQLSEFSGLPLDVIAGAEDGIHRLHEPHYLALAAVFDSTKYTEDASIYKALVRILTPENDFSYDSGEGDFILVKRWFTTFSMNDDEEEEEEYGHDKYDDDDGDMTSESNLEYIASEYRIFADTSAAEDENFPEFVERIEPLLRQNDSVISLPSAVLEKLRGDIDMSDDKSLQSSLYCVTRKISEGLIKLRTCPVLNADDIYEILARMFSETGENIMLITQDEERAEYFTSGNPNVTASRLTDGGGLAIWE